MLNEQIGAANIDHVGETNLCNDGSELTAGNWDAMRGRKIAGGEHLSRNDEGSGIGSKVLKEVGKAMKNNKTFNPSWCGSELSIAKAYQRLALTNSIIKKIHIHAHSGEQNGEYAETHKLNQLLSPRVNK